MAREKWWYDGRESCERLLYLFNATRRAGIGRRFATDGDAGVDSDHLGEDVEDGLGALAGAFSAAEMLSYLGHRLVVNVNKLSGVGVDLQSAVEAESCLD